MKTRQQQQQADHKPKIQLREHRHLRSHHAVCWSGATPGQIGRGSAQHSSQVNSGGTVTLHSQRGMLATDLVCGSLDGSGTSWRIIQVLFGRNSWALARLALLAKLFMELGGFFDPASLRGLCWRWRKAQTMQQDSESFVVTHLSLVLQDEAIYIHQDPVRER